MEPEPCDICGPQEPPTVHVICHVTEYARSGCGHLLKDHSDGLKCRVCKQECGVYCRV
jgi:hypothetical protein